DPAAERGEQSLRLLQPSPRCRGPIAALWVPSIPCWLVAALIPAQQAGQRIPLGQPPKTVPQGRVDPSPALAGCLEDRPGNDAWPFPGALAVRLRPRQDAFHL